MSEYFTKRRARKKRVLESVQMDRLVYQEKLDDIKKLDTDKQGSALIELKKETKEVKKQEKQRIKTLDRKQRRQQKKANKLYKKLKNRRRRAMTWSIVLVVIAIIIIQIKPMVSDLYVAISGKDITMDSSTPEGIAARQHGDKVSQEITDEGIVLLKNDDHNLPYINQAVNVFGISAQKLRYGGGGSGATDVSRAVSLFDAFDASGIAYNHELNDFYSGLAKKSKGEGSGLMQVVKGFLGMNSMEEPSIDHLSDDRIQQAKAYSEHAIIVITSSGTEASDFTLEQLKLSQNKRDLIAKVSENFENVTIIINAGNAIELGFIEAYPSIKSVVWMGTPGPFGASSLADILAGKINPSGRLTDTYAYEADSAPASENFGNYKYDNMKKAFINYQEGIYIGYRYYETFYENDEAGYQSAVQYPFGFGLSYTDFNWTVINADLNGETMSLTLDITNTGDVAGKEVVQLYYSAPYEAGGIEKSAIELASYAKTRELEPNETERLTLSFKTRDMASYDMMHEQAYVLDAGDYGIKLGRNVHDIVETINYTNPTRLVYQTNDKTDVAYQNRFDYAKGDLVYLSRNDWEKTYPSDDDLIYTASEELKKTVGEVDFSSDKDLPAFEVDNGLKLKDLKGLAYDDPKWDLFLDQFSLEELMNFVARGAYKTMPVERLGVPQTLLMDGPAGFSYFFGSYISAGYPSELVVVSTWNDALAYRFGEAVGLEARAYGIQGWYAPAMNIHRTAQGGRNFEYFSEDPRISGNISAAITRGAQDQDIIVFMKHFVMNDQETNARSGILVWANEQAMRELYLKPFEITVKEADVLGAMSSFSYLGTKWSGANTDLLYGILREEWGFDGFVSSDAVFGFMEAPDAIVSGNDLMLDIMSPSKNVKRLKKAYKEHPESIAEGLRTSTHHVLYTMLQTYIFD